MTWTWYKLSASINSRSVTLSIDEAKHVYIRECGGPREAMLARSACGARQRGNCTYQVKDGRGKVRAMRVNEATRATPMGSD